MTATGSWNAIPIDQPNATAESSARKLAVTGRSAGNRRRGQGQRRRVRGEKEQQGWRRLDAARGQIAYDARGGDDDVVDRDRNAPRGIHEASRKRIDGLHREHREYGWPDPVDVQDGAAGDHRGRRQRDDERGQDEQSGDAGEPGKAARRMLDTRDAAGENNVPDDDDQAQREVRRRKPDAHEQT